MEINYFHREEPDKLIAAYLSSWCRERTSNCCPVYFLTWKQVWNQIYSQLPGDRWEDQTICYPGSKSCTHCPAKAFRHWFQKELIVLSHCLSDHLMGCHIVQGMEGRTDIPVTPQENKVRSKSAEKYCHEGNEDYIIIEVRIVFHKIIISSWIEKRLFNVPRYGPKMNSKERARSSHFYLFLSLLIKNVCRI